MTAKKKNTLKDLDAFLKQEASSLATPKKIGKDINEQDTDTSKDTTTPPPEIAEEKALSSTVESSPKDISKENIITSLGQLQEKEGEQFRTQLYDIIKTAVENLPESTAADKMLINTSLYLAHQDNWKEAIRDYWEGQGQ